MRGPAGERQALAVEEGLVHRDQRRRENAARAGALAGTERASLVELACECTTAGCDRSVRVPLYVYERMLEADAQYLLQAGHHAFARYRTIVSVGMMRIEERA